MKSAELDSASRITTLIPAFGNFCFPQPVRPRSFGIRPGQPHVSFSHAAQKATTASLMTRPLRPEKFPPGETFSSGARNNSLRSKRRSAWRLLSFKPVLALMNGIHFRY